MNITPIEIRQKEFERHFRGYDKDEVNAFLHTLSQAWERMLQENRDKTARLEKAEKDIDKVREVEGSLFRTLRTAEDTSAGIVHRAQKEAEQIQQEAEARRQAIIDEARRQAESMLAEARQQISQLKQEATEAEMQRQQALAQLQTLAQRILQQVENRDALSNTVIHRSETQADEVEQTQEVVNAVIIEESAVPQEPVFIDSSLEDDSFSPAEEEVGSQDADETYEPVWATEEMPAPVQKTTPDPLRRKSFFDELD